MNVPYICSNIMILPEELQAEINSFDDYFFEIKLEEQERIEERNKKSRDRYPFYFYPIDQLKKNCLCKNYFDYKLNYIIKASKYIQHILKILSNIENEQKNIAIIENEIQDNIEKKLSLLFKSEKRRNLVADSKKRLEYERALYFSAIKKTYKLVDLLEWICDNIKILLYNTDIRSNVFSNRFNIELELEFDLDLSIFQLEKIEIDNYTSLKMSNIYKNWKYENIYSYNENISIESLSHYYNCASRVCERLRIKIVSIKYYLISEISAFCISEKHLQNTERKSLFVLPLKEYMSLDIPFSGFTKKEKEEYSIPQTQRKNETKIYLYEKLISNFEQLCKDAERELEKVQDFKDYPLNEYINNYEQENNKGEYPQYASKLTNLKSFLSEPRRRERICRIIENYHTGITKRKSIFLGSITIPSLAAIIVYFMKVYPLEELKLKEIDLEEEIWSFFTCKFTAEDRSLEDNTLETFRDVLKRKKKSFKKNVRLEKEIEILVKPLSKKKF